MTRNDLKRARCSDFDYSGFGLDHDAVRGGRNQERRDQGARTETGGSADPSDFHGSENLFSCGGPPADDRGTRRIYVALEIEARVGIPTSRQHP